MLNRLMFWLFLNLQVIDRHKDLINDKRVFFSEIRDTNALNSLLKKLKISMVPLNVRSYFMYSISLLLVVSIFGNLVR